MQKCDCLVIRSYINGLPEGDFYEWHENGNLKSMQQYKNGLKHGFFYIWTTKNVIFSRRFYRDGREDFSKFEDEGIAQAGASLASVELKEWEGTGPQFYQKFAGDPNRDGTVWIRETEELYTGTITALDDMGRKEAVLNFSKENITERYISGTKMEAFGNKENLVVEP